jgi:hypothetical protein
MKEIDASMKVILVGFENDEACDSEQTQRQIDEVIKLNCLLVDPQDHTQRITWADLNNPDEGRTLFQSILTDRRIRIDEKNLMADRPPFAVLNVVKGESGEYDQVIRLEYYEGHDALH